MLGAAIRAAMTLGVTMLAATVLKEILNPVLDILENSLGTNAMLYQMLASVRDEFIFVGILTAVVIMFVRAAVESRVRGI